MVCQPGTTPERPVTSAVRQDWAAASGGRRFVFSRMPGYPRWRFIDPQQLTLLVYRLTSDGYLLALTADTNSGRVRAEPFEAIEIEVAVLS